METVKEENEVNSDKMEAPSQQPVNTESNIECRHTLSQEKLAPHQAHALNAPEIPPKAEHSSFNKNVSPASKIDAATMTEPASECFEQNTASKQPHYEVTAMMPTTSGWHSFPGTPGATMVEYLSRLSAATLPLTFHHFLKYSSAPNEESNLPIADKLLKKEKEEIKNESAENDSKQCPLPATSQLTKALDASTLFCCPECHMAYPEKELLEEHLVLHQMERRFVCDICGAGLKRKEHLDRHKQGHSPDRPYTCSICLKAFKRNEHLSRHFITHTGDKSQVCIECGKGFYRKDHLHKHAQSHIAKRLRSEFYGKTSDTSAAFLPSNEEESSITLRPDAQALPIFSS